MTRQGRSACKRPSIHPVQTPSNATIQCGLVCSIQSVGWVCGVVYMRRRVYKHKRLPSAVPRRDTLRLQTVETTPRTASDVTSVSCHSRRRQSLCTTTQNNAVPHIRRSRFLSCTSGRSTLGTSTFCLVCSQTIFSFFTG